MKQPDSRLGPLSDGQTAVIIGGGPGGVATAIALQRGARALGHNVRVIMVEGKQFAGEQHHNQCVGVLSPPLTELLQAELGIVLPPSLTQDLITGYVLHTGRRQIVLDDYSAPSIALRRIQFDAYMLEAARAQGIEVLSARVTDIEFHADQIVVYAESTSLRAQVAVGAFGLDEGTAAIFTRAVGYCPPPALSAVVTKYHPGASALAGFGDHIHAFLPPTPRIEFGGITPKRNHLTINIAGATVDASLMDDFLSMPVVRQVLPGLADAARAHPDDLRYFKGRFPCGLARNFSGDRFVMVGDAAGLVRAFKGKGVTSAIQTGIRAARVILRQGISERAFQAYHAANADILSDLPYGQAMRYLVILGSRLGLLDVVLRAAETEPGLRQALFDSVSAHQPYKEVVGRSLTLTSMRAILAALAQAARSFR